MCEELPQLLKIKQFMEEENRVVYEHMKRCTTSVLLKIMQIQTAKMRFCFTNIGLQRIISLLISGLGHAAGKQEFIYCW